MVNRNWWVGEKYTRAKAGSGYSPVVIRLATTPTRSHPAGCQGHGVCRHPPVAGSAETPSVAEGHTSPRTHRLPRWAYPVAVQRYWQVALATMLAASGSGGQLRQSEATRASFSTEVWPCSQACFPKSTRNRHE